MSFVRAPWASLRTAVAVGGFLFSAGALILACLDYVGEELEACTSSVAEAGAFAVECPDASAGGTTTTSKTATGTGSGS